MRALSAVTAILLGVAAVCSLAIYARYGHAASLWACAVLSVSMAVVLGTRE